MNKFFIINVLILLISGCAKKETVVTPQLVNKLNLDVNPKRINESFIDLSIVPMAEDTALLDPLLNTSIDILIDSSESDSLLRVIEPQTSIAKEFDYDGLFPDSIWTNYMTRRGDYLSLIAYKEYNNANEWRRIYNWNRDEWEEKGIGPDKDNPNFIYPYKELDLKKPAKDVIEWVYDFYIHKVTVGETLWTIAKKEYNDELAWVVLFWDNEKILEGQDGKLLPGMELKVRSELWPNIK
tara:strand:+ start:213 stop:929 length:717 start_codon:yes stop_codon:yes gene_type:complete